MAQLRFELPHNIHKTWDSEKNTYEPVDINDTTPVWWKCKNGHSFIKSIPDLLDRVCCPRCRASQFEGIAHSILDSYGIEFECEYSPEWLSYKFRYDIRVLDANLLIEVDGGHHFQKVATFERYKAHNGENISFEDVVKRDNIKNKEAFDNNYKLLRIPVQYDADPNKIMQFIKLFLTEGLIAQDIIDYYAVKSFSNYSDIAAKMNENTRRNTEGYKSISLQKSKRVNTAVDITTIKTKLPENLLREWDFDNNVIHPSSIEAVSDKRKAWWICEKGHRFYRSIAYRIKNNDVCPICKADDVVRLVYETAAEIGLICWSNQPIKALDNSIYGFHIEETNMLIEFDRLYHFEDTVVNDTTYYYVDKVRQSNIKTQKAFDNNFRLLRIPYVFFDKPEKVKSFVREFLQHGVVMLEILDFYRQYPDNNYVGIAEQQNRVSY